MIIAIMCLGNSQIFAYDWIYRPSLGVSVTWDDNIEDEPTDQIEDFYLTINPRMGMTGRGERSTLTLDGSVSGDVYRKFEEFNEISNVTFDSEFDYNPSKVTNFNLPVTFVFTPSAETGTDTVSVDVEGGSPETVQITRRADRYRVFVGPSVRYTFSGRLSSRIRGRFRTTQYTQDVEDLQDTVAYLLAGNIEYAITRKTFGGLNVSYQTFDFEVDDDSDVYSTSLFLRYLYNRNVTLYTSGGISYISAENQDSEFAYIGSAACRLIFERTRYILDIRRSVDASDFGNTVTRDRARGRLIASLSKRLEMSLDGIISRNESSDGSEDLIIKRIALQMDYRPLEHLSLFIRGSHEDQDERAVAGEDLRINRVTTGFILWGRLGGVSPRPRQ